MKIPFQKYPKESAGRIMTSRVPLILSDQTMEEVKLMLSTQEKEFDTINYLYVIDKEGKLIGVISVKDIFNRPAKTKVEEIMTSFLIKADFFTDQEKIAVLALKNNLKAIPIVDKENHFLGVVDSNTILDVLHREHIEDILLRGGIPKIDTTYAHVLEAPASTLIKARGSWLLLGLFGGVIAAQIIGFFENVLKEEILLVLFIPVIVYMSDAVATQTETLFIRGLAVDHALLIQRYLKKEIKVGVALGALLGGTLAIIASLWWASIKMGIILFLAMFFGILLATIVAILIPLLLRKFKQDPAIGAGPFSTIITDILSIITYFLIANFFLGIL